MRTMTLRATIAAPVAIASAAVSGLGLAVELVHTGSHAHVVEWLVAFFSLSYEQNLPTWYASSLLLACAVLLLAIGRDARVRHRRFALAWLVLAAGFAVMSLDEASELHEDLHGLVDGGDVLYFDWVIPAGIAVVAIGVAFVPFLRALPPIRRRHILLAGAVYLGGALVMELPLGWWTARHGADSTGYALIDWVEESLELAGATWFLLVLTTRWDERAEATA
jgi:predicted Co/Zn/Cd cation transporter (cation efflux family)